MNPSIPHALPSRTAACIQRGARLPVLLLLASLPCSAAQTDWQHRLPSFQAEPDGGALVRALPEGGFLLTSQSHASARFDDAGNFVAWIATPGQFDLIGDGLVQGGGWSPDTVGLDYYMPASAARLCRRGIDATTGLHTWRLDPWAASHAPLHTGLSGRLDAGGGTWAAFSDPTDDLDMRLVRLGPDCAPTDTVLELPNNRWPTLANDPSRRGAYALFHAWGTAPKWMPAAPPTSSELARIGPDGIEWSVPIDVDGWPRLRVTQAGDALVEVDDGWLRFSPDGQLRHVLPATGWLDDGEALWIGTSAGLDRIGPDGEVERSDALPITRAPHPVASIPRSASDRIWTSREAGAQGETAWIARDETGVHRIVRFLPSGCMPQLQLSRQTLLVLCTGADANGFRVLVGNDASADRRVSWPAVTLPGDLLAQHADAWGSQVLLRDPTGEIRLVALDRDGQAIWDGFSTLDPAFSGNFPWTIATGADRICVAARKPLETSASLLQCMARQTGLALFDPITAASVGPANASVAADGSLLRFGDGRVWRVESDGTVVEADAPEDAAQLAFERSVQLASGEVLVPRYVEWRAREVVVFGPDGAERRRIAIPQDVAPGTQSAGLIGHPDGGWMLTGGDGDGIRFLRFDAQGGLSWSTRQSGFSSAHIDVAVGDGFWTVLEQFPYRDRVLLALDDASGDERWRHTLRLGAEPWFRAHGWQPEVFASGSDLALVFAPVQDSDAYHPRPLPPVIEWRSGATGRLLDRSVLREFESLDAATAGSSGEVLLSATRRTTQGVEHVLNALRADAFEDQSAPIAQPGLRGTWYDPASSGQGLYLDFLPEADLVSGAWFTYGEDGGTDRAGQRWFTLVGETESGAAEVRLDVRRQSGGRFAQGPAVPSETIGEAWLRLTNCDRAVLSYAIVREDGSTLDGEIALRRLTPAALPCATGSGAGTAQVAPAHATVGETDPAASSSGFWYDPAASGQGLAAEFIDGDGFAAAWFTFDPEGQADDPDAQHWFTLVGARDQASGAYEVQILRSIGGSFAGEPTRNTYRVGEATLELSACDGARLDYRFDASDYAAAFAGLEGQIGLARLGLCEE